MHVLGEDILELCKIPFLIPSAPTSFSVCCFLLELIILMRAAKWWFSNLIISSTFISWFSIVRKNFLFSSIMYLFPSGWIHELLFLVSYNIHIIIYIDVKIVLDLTIVNFFTLNFLFFWHSPIHWWKLSYLGKNNRFQSHLVLFLPQS